jgi:dethiobiotin synthetase
LPTLQRVQNEKNRKPRPNARLNEFIRAATVRYGRAQTTTTNYKPQPQTTNYKQTMTPIFITGIGTGIGKTCVSAIVAKALEADYWKPIQAGYEEGTDGEFVSSVLGDSGLTVFPEVYKLRQPASPHIAAREEGIRINIGHICNKIPINNRTLLIEGAGGLLVPLNETEFVADLIHALNAKVILVSRNYLGSINHSLLTARVCREMQLPVIGWVFNDQYLDYEDEIVKWSNFPRIASIPYSENINGTFINSQAAAISKQLKAFL